MEFLYSKSNFNTEKSKSSIANTNKNHGEQTTKDHQCISINDRFGTF